MKCFLSPPPLLFLPGFLSCIRSFVKRETPSFCLYLVKKVSHWAAVEWMCSYGLLVTWSQTLKNQKLHSKTCWFYCSFCLFLPTCLQQLQPSEILALGVKGCKTHLYYICTFISVRWLYQCQDQPMLFAGLFIRIHSYWRRSVPGPLWALWMQRPLGHLPPWNWHLHGKKCTTSMWLIFFLEYRPLMPCSDV